MKELDEIIYDALCASPQVIALVGDRIQSTCIEVPPTEDDNTPLPYIIITDDSLQNEQGTKDSLWESETDRVQASVEIAAGSPHEVKTLRRLIRRAIANYVETLDEIPYLQSVTNDGIAWDWLKPCYYDTLHYQADMGNYLTEDEQEENGSES